MTRDWRSEYDECLRRLRLHEKEANRLRDENYELKEQIAALKLKLQESK